MQFAPDPSEAVAMRDEVRALLMRLSYREREVISRRYGALETHLEIGKALRLTRERVRQIEHRALGKMRRM